MYSPILFDEQYFYHKNGKAKIPISSIQAIKLTHFSNGKQVQYWEITFFTNKVEKVRILPPTLEDSFARFLDYVKAKNPAVDVDIFEFKLKFGFLPFCYWRPR